MSLPPPLTALVECMNYVGVHTPIDMGFGILTGFQQLPEDLIQGMWFMFENEFVK